MATANSAAKSAEAFKAETNNFRAEASSAELQAQIAALKSDIAALTSTIADYGKAKGKSAAASAKATMEDARAKGGEQLAVFQDEAVKAYRSVETSARENPAAAVGIAAGIGFLFGLLTTRR